MLFATNRVGHRIDLARLILIALASLCLSSCSRRDGLNFDCDWIADPTFEVNPKNETTVHHLLDDIRAAEELAIRYGDRVAGWRLADTFGIVSRHGGLKNRDAGRLAQQQCIAKLFSDIGSRHGLTVSDIEALRPRLMERGVDLPVTVPVGLLFAFALRRFVQWLRNRFEPGEVLPWVIATVIGSVILTSVVLAIGGAWAVLVEIVRIGNEHLSYRARTASLQRNLLVIFIAGIALTWISSASAAVSAHRRRTLGS